MLDCNKQVKKEKGFGKGNTFLREETLQIYFTPNNFGSKLPTLK